MADSSRREIGLRLSPVASAASSAYKIDNHRGMHRHHRFDRHGSRVTNSRLGIAAPDFRLRLAVAVLRRPPVEATPATAPLCGEPRRASCAYLAAVRSTALHREAGNQVQRFRRASSVNAFELSRVGTNALSRATEDASNQRLDARSATEYERD